MLIFDQRHFPKNMLLVIFSKSLNVARKIEKTNQKKTACVQLVSSYFFFRTSWTESEDIFSIFSEFLTVEQF